LLVMYFCLHCLLVVGLLQKR